MTHTQKELLAKAARYCSYQERCHSEVRTKLLQIGARGTDLDVVMAELIQHNLLNEERFARAFAGGKFRQKQWGRLKIVRELKQRDISAYCINAGLKEIDEDDYLKALKQLLTKRQRFEKEKNPKRRMAKLAAYAQSHGFEASLVWALLKETE